MVYHDLIIKDGNFVGEFEKLYQEYDDPWNQKKTYNSISRQVVCNYIKHFQINSAPLNH